MKRFFYLILFFVLLTSCTGGPFTVATATPTLTPLPTNTPSPTVTATATLEPTKNPEVLATEIGLNSERQYKVEEKDGKTFLVDMHNNAPKAVQTDDGTWRKLDYTNKDDAEIMYGRFVPEGEYIIPDYWFQPSSGEKGQRFYSRFLGDWETEPAKFRNKDVQMLVLLAGLRDGDGIIHIVRIVLDSEDVLPAHWTHVATHQLPPDESWSAITLPLNMLDEFLRVGESIEVEISLNNHMREEAYWESKSEKLENNTQSRLLANLYNNYPVQYQMTPRELGKFKDNQWPERIVTIIPNYPFIEVERTMEEQINFEQNIQP